MKWFVNGQPSDYGGGRSQDTIVPWIKKMSHPAVIELASQGDIDDLIEILNLFLTNSHATVVVGYFAKGINITHLIYI